MTRQMKNTRFHWMGEIPSHWKLIKLGYLCSLKGRIGWKGLRSDEFLEDSYAYLVTGQDFAGDTVNWAACYQIEKGRYDEDPYIQLKKGDLLVTKDGTIGKIAKVHKLDKPACLNSGIFVLRQTANKFDQSYLYWQLNSSLLADYNSFVNSGASTIQHLYQNVFERMPLIVPPLSEQKAIADFLDTKCAEIDGLLADLDAEVKTLTEYKKSIIAETVTRGLNSNALMKSSGIPWVGEIPKHWQLHPVYYYYTQRVHKNIFGDEQNLLSLSFGKIIRKDINSIGGLIPASYNTYNIVEKDDIIIRPTDLQNDKRSLRTGLVTEHGIITSAYIALKPNSDVYSPFFHYLLHSYDVKKVFYNMGNGVRQGLNYSEFSRLMLIEPPKDEQIEIANYLDSKCVAIDKAITDKTQQIETLKAYKSSLIYEYVTGKKQVI